MQMPSDPSERIFWGFILSGFILVALVAFMQGHRDLTRQQFRRLFSFRYWWTRDTFVDVGLLCSNGLLKLFLLVPLLGAQLAIALMFARALANGFGDAPQLFLGGFWIIALYSLVFFVLEDASRFGLHLALHKLPLLWHFHKVHHSAEHLTPLTLYRIHPVEMTLYYFRSMLVFGVVTGVFIYLFGPQLSAWEILGVDALGFLFNLAGANLRHSPIWLSFGKLEKWLISPAQHQIHHSAAPEHKDLNFGVCLSCWDRLLGTWQAAGLPRNMVFGLSTRSRRVFSV